MVKKMLKEVLVKGKVYEVTFKKLFEPKDGKWGKTQGGYVQLGNDDVQVYLKERDIGNIKEGMKVNCMLDGSPKGDYIKWIYQGDNGEKDALIQRQEVFALPEDRPPLPIDKFPVQENQSLEKKKFDYKLAFLGNLKIFESYIVKRLDYSGMMERSVREEIFTNILDACESLTDMALSKIDNKFKK